jgi:hypothetical protein
MECKTYFDLITAGYHIPGTALFAAFAGLFGCLIIWANRRRTQYSGFIGWLAVKLSLPIFVIVFFYFAIRISTETYANYRELVKANDSGGAKLVEGSVMRYSPYDSQMKKMRERFEVDGVEFSYAPDMFHVSFQKTGEDSPIRDGIYVKILYVGNEIIKLETCTLSSPIDGSNHRQ